MLAGAGFEQVYNVAGGIQAWGSGVAVGEPLHGLELFSDLESPSEVLKTAYSLEQGLRDFYLDMADQFNEPPVHDLFLQLAEIEVKHQDSIYEMYTEMVEDPLSREAFESGITQKALEGGRTTEEYLAAFSSDLTSETVVISLAMSIEAQALDLYLRAAAQAEEGVSQEAFYRIANEEKAHLAMLGDLMEEVQA